MTIANEQKSGAFDPYQITRPDPQLWRYYFYTCCFLPPITLLGIPGLWFRYSTIRYRFDESGVAMSWGVFFKKEVYLTYRRIQDIHISRGILQRWMGLANVSIQTASGSALPEMVIEGILQADELRDFLYSKMRGAKGDTESPRHAAVASDFSPSINNDSQNRSTADDRAIAMLRDIRDSLQKLVEKQESSK